MFLLFKSPDGSKMGFTIDEVLERIGSMGLYQIRPVAIISYMVWFNLGYQVLQLTFVAGEPPWHCAANSTSCSMTCQFSVGHAHYNKGCSMNRDDWEFSNNFTSVETEVSREFKQLVWIQLRRRLGFFFLLYHRLQSTSIYYQLVRYLITNQKVLGSIPGLVEG